MEAVTEVGTTDLVLPHLISTSEWFEGSGLEDSSYARVALGTAKSLLPT